MDSRFRFLVEGRRRLGVVLVVILAVAGMNIHSAKLEALLATFWQRHDRSNIAQGCKADNRSEPLSP
jgi:hypothetical protein